MCFYIHGYPYFLIYCLGMSPGRQPLSPRSDIPLLYRSPSPLQSADGISGEKINHPSIFLPSLGPRPHGKSQQINQMVVPPDTQITDPPACLSLVPTSTSLVVRIHCLKFIRLLFLK